MNQFVVIGFDEEYQRWGLSSLISLRKLAGYQGNIFVVGVELSATTCAKIADLDATLIKIPRPNCIRGATLDSIVTLANKHQEGYFVYWDADVYFQDSIDEIFSIDPNKFLATKNQGFLAAPHFRWRQLGEIKNSISLINDSLNGTDIFNLLVRHHSKWVKELDQTWNFVDIPRLKSDGDLLTYNNEVVKTIHPSGFIRDFTPNRNILFWERHQDLFKRVKVLRCTTHSNTVQHNT